MIPDLDDPLSLSALLREQGALPAPGIGGGVDVAGLSAESTTIVGLRHSGGSGAVLVADRRASAGHRIVKDDMTKLFLADRASAVGIAGTAGMGVELARLFALELEHVEKIERSGLSHEGKVRRLSMVVATNLPLAMQGLAAVPILGGFDAASESARLHTFDATGGVYEEPVCAALGSGGDVARAVVEARIPRHGASVPDIAEAEALSWALAALRAAARQDSATSGPDGRSLPVAVAIDSDGARLVPDEVMNDARTGEGA